MISIQLCQSDQDFSDAIALTRAYIDWLDMDLAFQNIATELENFSHIYCAPAGSFLLAKDGNQVAGGVGLRALDFGSTCSNLCEMKRLYVYDSYQGKGIGNRLCKRLINRATELGYRGMRLDTLGKMEFAHGLYNNLGFNEIEPYRFNPDPTTRYLELLFD